MNDLYITDYCVWLQTCSEAKLHKLAKSIRNVTVSKDDVGLSLGNIERIAESLSSADSESLDSDDDSDVGDLVDTLQSVNLNREPDTHPVTDRPLIEELSGL